MKLPIYTENEARPGTRPQGDACSLHGKAHVANVPEGELFADANFAGNVLLVTLGCAKNLVDSEVMLGALHARGFRPITNPAEADLIVVNTCAFLQSAVEEGVDKILELARYKETGRCRRLVVAGCMVERYRKDLEESLPEVDRFVSTDELLTIADDASTTEATLQEARRPYFIYDESMPRIRSTGGHTAFVKIAEGCDRPCAFCIIPKIRGNFRSRPLSSVLSEAEGLVGEGVKELNLVAQDLTSYGIDLQSEGGLSAKKPQLIELIRGFDEIHKRISADFWVRLLYAYPIGVNDEFIRAMIDSPVVCNYLDLPLQHISNAVLKRMNRPLGEKGTRGLIEEIRRLAPQLQIRTTFVVGFPGETEEDVRALEEFVSAGHFTHVGVFPYSQESEAKAFTFPEQVPDELKLERQRRIMEIQQKNVASRLEQLIGKNLSVLVDGYHEDSELLLTGRVEWQAPETDGCVLLNEISEELMTVHPETLEADFSLRDFQGKFVNVEITEVAGYDLVGRINSLCGR